MERRPQANATEEAFAQLAEAKGWRPSKRGWPDFLCYLPDGTVAAVEVKPRTTTGRLKLLKRAQVDAMNTLHAAGIPCYVSDGETLEPYDEATHGDPKRRRRSRRA